MAICSMLVASTHITFIPSEAAGQPAARHYLHARQSPDRASRDNAFQIHPLPGGNLLNLLPCGG